METLEQAQPPVEIFVEYMDVLRLTSKDDRTLFLYYLIEKFRGHRFDAVITVDDQAYQFVLEHRIHLVPGVPLVFCAVRYPEFQADDMSNITGVAVKTSTADSISLIQQLLPKVKRVLILGDRSLIYESERGFLLEGVKGMDSLAAVEIAFFEDPRLTAILDMVATLPSDHALYLMGIPTDDDGMQLPLSESTRAISQASRVPLFGGVDTLLGYGLIGGKLVSSQAQGKTGAQLVLRILGGEPAGEIPVILESPNQYMFDYNQLERFKIPLYSLPANSSTINLPFSRSSVFRETVITGGVIITLLVIIIGALITNMSLRRRAEKELQVSEENYRKLYESMNQGVLQQDAEERLISANPAAERILGVSLRNRIGEPLGDDLPFLEEGESQPSFHNNPMQEALRTGSVVSRLVGIPIPRENRKHWVIVNAAPQFQPGDQQPYNVYTTLMDVTELLEAEDALRQSEERYRNLVESINDWVVELDTRGNYIYVGPQVHTILGRTPPEVLGKNFTAFMPHREALRVGRIFREHLEKKEPFLTLEITCMHRDGHPVILETNGIPFFDEDGQLQGFRGINRDITARRQADELLKQANWNLSRAYEATLEGWSRALELRELETAGHSQRVVSMTLQLARKLGVPEGDLPHIRRGALLHDIGKMGIPDKILQKPGPLTEEEWVIMRMHPVYAHALLSPIPFLRQALDIPYCHHERWDGNGYPRGLRGWEIPLAARIFSVVDAWDALTSARPYRPAWKDKKAQELLLEESGNRYDPVVVEAFLDILDHLTIEMQDTRPLHKRKRPL